MTLGFYGSVVLWLYGLARPRSSLALVPWPRSDFHDFFWDFQDFFAHRPCLLVSFDPKNLVGLYIIARAIYHKSLGDIPSMLMEICG